MNGTGPSLLLRVQQLRDLPVLSLVREESLDLMRHPHRSRRDLAHVLKHDQVLSAKVLRLVNSSSYSLTNTVGDIEKALSFIGDHSLHTLLLGSNIFVTEDLNGPFRIADYWLHNYLVAFGAAHLAQLSGHADPSEAFSCGLLHDLGKLALWKGSPDTFTSVLDHCRFQGTSFLSAEVSLSLPGHHVLGEAVATAWKLPVFIRKAMRFHHRDVQMMSTLEETTRRKIYLVIVANQLTKVLLEGCAWGQPETELSTRAAESLRLSTQDLLSTERALSTESERVLGKWHQLFPSKKARAA